MNGSMPAVQENSSSGPQRERFANDNWGTAVTWGVGLLGYSPPEGPPVMELGSPLGGRLSGPGFLCHLIIHASPRPRHSTSEKKKKKEKKKGEKKGQSGSFVSATGRYFDCLLAASPDNRRAQEQLPLAEVSGWRGEEKVKGWGSKESQLYKRQTAKGDARI